MTDLIKELKKMDLGKILTNVSLKEYTTYKVGGTAQMMIFPKDIDSLVTLIKKLKTLHVKYMVLGNGSNVLFSDSVYEGVLIKLDEFNKIEFQDNKVICGAGASLMKVAIQSTRKGLTGLEFATGIPGSIGGAVYMNAGAFGSEMKTIVTYVKYVDEYYLSLKLMEKKL